METHTGAGRQGTEGGRVPGGAYGGRDAGGTVIPCQPGRRQRTWTHTPVRPGGRAAECGLKRSLAVRGAQCLHTPPGSVVRGLPGVFRASAGPWQTRCCLWLRGHFSYSSRRTRQNIGVRRRPHACHLCPRTGCSSELRTLRMRPGSVLGEAGRALCLQNSVCHHPLSTPTERSKDRVLKVNAQA